MLKYKVNDLLIDIGKLEMKFLDHDRVFNKVVAMENEHDKLKNYYSSLYTKFSMGNDKFEEIISRQKFDYSRRGLRFDSSFNYSSSKPFVHSTCDKNLKNGHFINAYVEMS